jgi:hypothetical protein
MRNKTNKKGTISDVCPTGQVMRNKTNKMEQ